MSNLVPSTSPYEQQTVDAEMYASLVALCKGAMPHFSVVEKGETLCFLFLHLTESHCNPKCMCANQYGNN